MPQGLRRLEQNLQGIFSLDYSSLCLLGLLRLTHADVTGPRNGHQQRLVQRLAIDSSQHSPYQRREIRTHVFSRFEHLIMSESSR